MIRLFYFSPRTVRAVAAILLTSLRTENVRCYHLDGLTCGPLLIRGL